MDEIVIKHAYSYIVVSKKMFPICDPGKLSKVPFPKAEMFYSFNPEELTCILCMALMVDYEPRGGGRFVRRKKRKT